MGKKLAGILPKNQAEPAKDYQPPKERKRVEVEEADDGTFTIRCMGGEGPDVWRGKTATASTFEEAMSKVESHFSGKSKKKG